MPDISQKRILEFVAGAAPPPSQVAASIPKRSLAIVVPCYGHARFLKTMLTSITSQSRLPDEVVFIDDCSPDGSGDIIERFIDDQREQGNTRFTLMQNTGNAGQAMSLNRGISATDSDLIMILNDDDYLMHDAVEVTFRLFDCYQDVVMVGGSSIHFSNDDELAKADKSIVSYMGFDTMAFDIRYPKDTLNYRNYNDLNMTHSGCTFLKFVWEMAGGYYPEKNKRLVPFSDRDFQLRVNALFPVAVSDQTPFSFWRNNSSVDAGRNS